MKPIVSQAGLRRWLAPPDLREQGAIWALALLGFAVSSIGYEHARATMPSLGFDCARPRSVRVERGFTRDQTGGIRRIVGLRLAQAWELAPNGDSENEQTNPDTDPPDEVPF